MIVFVVFVGFHRNYNVSADF